MSAITIKTNKQAKETLQRATCITLVMEQTFRQCQLEDPFCTAALAETLAHIGEMIEQVVERFDVIEREEKST